MFNTALSAVQTLTASRSPLPLEQDEATVDGWIMRALGIGKARRPAPWLGSDVSKDTQRVIRRAMLDLGIAEMPEGSNRSPRIDEYTRAAGIPESLITTGKAYWCAAWATAMWRECGFETAGFGADGSCDRIMEWAKATLRWSKAPTLGAFILYGVPGDARHIGLVVRLSPLLTVEGNAAWGGEFTRNGEAVVLRRVRPENTGILGYASLRPA